MKQNSRMIKVVFIIVMTLLLSACRKENSNQIEIKNPIAISQNNVILSNGEELYLNLELINGNYFCGQTGGGTYQTNWKGEYQIRIFKDYNETEDYISIFPIEIDEKQMNFSGEFKIVFDDYNDDSNLDFTLGQYGTGSSHIFRMFTVLPNKLIEELKCGDGNYQMIANQDFSFALDKVSSDSFKTQTYDNEQAKLIDVIYQWRNDKFVVKMPT